MSFATFQRHSINGSISVIAAASAVRNPFHLKYLCMGIQSFPLLS
jgi:hypothetical protein